MYFVMCAILQHLYGSFEEVPGVFQFATAITSDDLEEIQKFLDTAVNTRYCDCLEEIYTVNF